MLITPLVEGRGPELLSNPQTEYKRLKEKKVSSLCVTMLPVRTEYVQNFFISSFNTGFMGVFSPAEPAVEQSDGDDRRSCHPPPPPLNTLQSAGGGKLHRHTAFTQLPYVIATERS